MNSLPKRQGQDFTKLFKGANVDGIDLIRQMLLFDHEKRITVDQALAHPFFATLHDPAQETTAE
jgi:serine/threonine protein kinase